MAIVERSDYDKVRIGETLSPEGVRLLRNLGIWDNIPTDVIRRSPGNVSAWGSDDPAEYDFIFNPFGSAWRLDRRQFDRFLANEAVRAGARLFQPSVIRDCRRERNLWHVRLDHPRGPVSLTADVLIDATGRAAWLAQRQGSIRTAFDRLVGIAAVIKFCGEDSRTYVEARPDGWWYSGLLPGDRAVAIFFTDPDLHDLSPVGRKNLWETRMAQSVLTLHRLGAICLSDVPKVLPAASSRLDRCAGEGWFAIGDAAFTLDPLSSSGISWAIASGADAAAVVSNPYQPDSLSQVCENVGRRFGEYRRTRQSFYQMEKRWPDSPFWERNSKLS